MKRKVYLFAAALLVLTLGAGFVLADRQRAAKLQKHALENLSRELVKALNRTDYNAFAAMLLTEPELEKIYARTEARGGSDYYHLKDVHTVYAGMYRKTMSSFVTVISAGLKERIDWKQTRFESCSFEVETKDGFGNADLKIAISCRNKRYSLRCRDVVYTGKAWKMAGKLTVSFFSTEETMQRELREKQLTDSLTKVIESYLTDSTLMQLQLHPDTTYAPTSDLDPQVVDSLFVKMARQIDSVLAAEALKEQLKEHKPVTPEKKKDD